jgi:hypothetical protein
MNGRDFLLLATRLTLGNTEADGRTAVRRAYYAAFHVARRLLADLARGKVCADISGRSTRGIRAPPEKSTMPHFPDGWTEEAAVVMKAVTGIASPPAFLKDELRSRGGQGSAARHGK